MHPPPWERRAPAHYENYIFIYCRRPVCHSPESEAKFSRLGLSTDLSRALARRLGTSVSKCRCRLGAGARGSRTARTHHAPHGTCFVLRSPAQTLVFRTSVVRSRSHDTTRVRSRAALPLEPSRAVAHALRARGTYLVR